MPPFAFHLLAPLFLVVFVTARLVLFLLHGLVDALSSSCVSVLMIVLFVVLLLLLLLLWVLMVAALLLLVVLVLTAFLPPL